MHSSLPTGNIVQIELRLWTSNSLNSSTAGRVYFGATGREFAVKSDKNSGEDFKYHPEGSVFIFGETTQSDGKSATVALPAYNDPARGFPTQFAEITQYPMYIRLDPSNSDDNWHLHRADSIIRYEQEHGASSARVWRRLAGGPSIWLGTQRGLYLYFDTSSFFRLPDE